VSGVILWFRRDLRLTDNPALQAALTHATRLLPVYIHAPDEEAPWQPGAASRWWLDHSLRQLDRSLRRLGSRLIVREGPSLQTLQQLCADHRLSHVYWNRLYDPATRPRDGHIKSSLSAEGIHCVSQNAGLLYEPWQVQTNQGAPYRVFSAFWRTCIQMGVSSTHPSPSPSSLPPLPARVDSLPIERLELQSKTPWYGGLQAHWQPGEAAGLQRLAEFLDGTVADYAAQRDLPGLNGTSRLSPHLHFGEIGPRQVLHGIQSRIGLELTVKGGSGAAVFVRELGWREFAYHLLYHYPASCDQPLDARFRDFPWQGSEQAGERLQAWQRGQTGMPIVDAGMRELWQTGWMHNRVRMIVASLLTKNLGIHWLEGARWFWDTLVDADLANNSLGWQWTAGCGADAAPFFRVFNPIRQSERFDPKGDYLRRWLPELAALSDAELHAPWQTAAERLRRAGILMEKDYPLPLVDLKSSRQQALKAWETIKNLRDP
jgi:deoxyribodipyrimidine photo-lyase